MLLVWITYYLDCGEMKIDKVFDTEGKAIRHIEYKDKMTGEPWGYICKELES